MKNKPYPLYSIPKLSDLKDMVKKRTESMPDSVAFFYSKGKDGTENKTSADFSNDINAIGTYIYSKELKNSNIAIVADNSYEWLVAFLAITNGGNRAVPIDKDLPTERIASIIQQTECKAIFTSKYKNDESEIITFKISDFPDMINLGNELITEGNMDYINYKVNPDDIAAVFMTSGTTGNSKGVMLSHKNIISNVMSTRRYAEIKGTAFSVLPYNHAFGLVIGVFSVYAFGCKVFICRQLKRLLSDFKTAAPDAVALVPLFVETFYKNIFNTIKKEGKTKKFNTAVKVSDTLVKFGIDLRPKLFKSVSSAFGGKLKYIVCGGAALDSRYTLMFRSVGINIINGYGITECSPVISMTRNNHWRDGSVGQVLKSCEVKIADDGEILVKGENVMLGYYNDEENTKKAFCDGWYATGDLGKFDEDGFLYITGRKKNLIILSNGENVSPEEIESKILLIEGVSEAVVYENKGILTVQIFPEQDYIGNQEYFENAIKEYNKPQPAYRQIQKIILRENEFEKNNSKKILRFKVNNN